MLTFKEFTTESLRLLHTVGNGPRTAKVYKDAEWGEHRVKFFTDGNHHKEADYHTDDKQDAHDTANYWVNEQPKTESVVTSTNVCKFFPKKKVVDGVTINPTIPDPKNKSIEEAKFYGMQTFRLTDEHAHLYDPIFHDDMVSTYGTPKEGHRRLIPINSPQNVKEFPVEHIVKTK